MTSTALGTGSLRYTTFMFYNVEVSNAGRYQCRATVSSTQSNVIGSTGIVSNNSLGILYVQSKSKLTNLC